MGAVVWVLFFLDLTQKIYICHLAIASTPAEKEHFGAIF